MCGGRGEGLLVHERAIHRCQMLHCKEQMRSTGKINFAAQTELKQLNFGRYTHRLDARLFPLLSQPLAPSDQVSIASWGANDPGRHRNRKNRFDDSPRKRLTFLLPLGVASFARCPRSRFQQIGRGQLRRKRGEACDQHQPSSL